MEEIIINTENIELKNKKDRNLSIFALISSIVIMIASIIAFIIFEIPSYDSDSDNNSSTYSDFTYSNYLRIEEGMTYEEVEYIFGFPGELTSSSSYGEYTSELYVWENYSGTKIVSVYFSNNEVTTKSQVGLN